jgi:hypothetical protein
MIMAIASCSSLSMVATLKRDCSALPLTYL